MLLREALTPLSVFPHRTTCQQPGKPLTGFSHTTPTAMGTGRNTPTWRSGTTTSSSQTRYVGPGASTATSPKATNDCPTVSLGCQCLPCTARARGTCLHVSQLWHLELMFSLFVGRCVKPLQFVKLCSASPLYYTAA